MEMGVSGWRPPQTCLKQLRAFKKAEALNPIFPVGDRGPETKWPRAPKHRSPEGLECRGLPQAYELWAFGIGEILVMLVELRISGPCVHNLKGLPRFLFGPAGLWPCWLFGLESLGLGFV